MVGEGCLMAGCGGSKGERWALSGRGNNTPCGWRQSYPSIQSSSLFIWWCYLLSIKWISLIWAWRGLWFSLS